MLTYLSEFHPANLDRSLLPTLVYHGHEPIASLTDDNETAFFDQFDELVNTLNAQAISAGFSSDRLAHLLALKLKVRNKELTTTDAEIPVYYPYLKGLLEEFCLLINQTAKEADRKDIMKGHLLPELGVCGPGLLSHKQTSLGILKAGINYQACLANMRERLIEALAFKHIQAKKLPAGTEIHVFNFIANYLSNYSFTPLREVIADRFANPAYCKIYAKDLEAFTDFIRTAYTPSKIIPQLAEYIQDKFKAFFDMHGLPFDASNPEKARLLLNYYEQLALGADDWENITRVDESYVVKALPTLIDIQSYLLKKWLSSTHRTMATAAESPLLTADDHFYDEIADASQKLAQTHQIILVEDKIDDYETQFYFLADYLKIHPNPNPKLLSEIISHFENARTALYFLTTAEIVNFSGISLEGIDLSYAKCANLSFNHSTLKGADLSIAKFENCDLREIDLQNATLSNTSFKNCQIGDDIKLTGATIDNLSFRQLYQAGVRNFKGVNFAEPLDCSYFLSEIVQCDFAGTSANLKSGTVLTNNDFRKLYFAGIRNFSCIHASEVLSMNDIDFNACDFSNAYISISHAKLDNASFRKLLKFGIKMFTSITMTEPLDTENIDLEHLRFNDTHITFKPGTTFNKAQFKHLVKQGVDFKGTIITEPLELFDTYFSNNERSTEGHYFNFKGVTVQLEPGTVLSSSQLFSLFKAGFKNFRGVKSGDKTVDGQITLLRLSLNLTIVDLEEFDFTGADIVIDVIDTELNNELFKKLYALGTRNFYNCRTTEPLDLEGVDIESLKFSSSTITFKPGIRLNNEQFRQLCNQGITNFQRIIATEPFDFNSLRGNRFFGSSYFDFSDYDFTGAHFCFSQGSILRENAIAILYQQGLRDFKNAKLVNITLPPTLAFEGCKFTGCTIDSSSFIALYHAGIRDFCNTSLKLSILPKDINLTECQFIGCTVDKQSCNRFVDQGIKLNAITLGYDDIDTTEFKDTISSNNIKRFSHIKFMAVSDLSDLDLDNYVFKDCNLELTKVQSKNALYCHLRLDFIETITSLLDDYANPPMWTFHNRHHIKAINDVVKVLRQNIDRNFLELSNPLKPPAIFKLITDALGKTPIKPNGELMSRIRFAIKCHSCFDPLTVDDVVAKYFHSTQASVSSMPLAATAMNPHAPANAGAGVSPTAY